MNINQMFPRKYANGEDLNGTAHVMTIKRVAVEKMRVSAQAKEEDRFILYFDGAQKGVILSKTLAVQIASILKEQDTDRWTGKQIVIFPERMMVGGVERIAIRARAVT